MLITRDRPLAPHRSRIGVPSPLLGLANLRLVESAPDGDAEHVLDMFKHQNCKTDPTRRALSVRRRTVHVILFGSLLSIGVGSCLVVGVGYPVRSDLELPLLCSEKAQESHPSHPARVKTVRVPPRAIKMRSNATPLSLNYHTLYTHSRTPPDERRGKS